MADVDKKISSFSNSTTNSTTKPESSIFNLFGNIGQTEEKKENKEYIAPVSVEENKEYVMPSEKVEEEEDDEEENVKEEKKIENPVNLNKNTDESLYSLFGYSNKPAAAAAIKPVVKEEVKTSFLNSINPFASTPEKTPIVLKEEPPIVEKELVVEEKEEESKEEPIVKEEVNTSFLNSINPFASTPEKKESIAEEPEPIVEEESNENLVSESPILSSNEYLNKMSKTIENPFTEKKGGKTKNRKYKNKQKTQKRDK